MTKIPISQFIESGEAINLTCNNTPDRFTLYLRSFEDYLLKDEEKVRKYLPVVDLELHRSLRQFQVLNMEVVNRGKQVLSTELVKAIVRIADDDDCVYTPVWGSYASFNPKICYPAWLAFILPEQDSEYHIVLDGEAEKKPKAEESS